MATDTALLSRRALAASFMHALGLDERRLGGIGTARFYEVAQQAHAFPIVWRGRRCLTEAAGPVASGHGRE
jgi:hypothetical protein